MMTNQERATRLNDILPGYPEDQHTNLIDLLTDAMQHWCSCNDAEFDELLRMARQHFEAEMIEPT